MKNHYNSFIEVNMKSIAAYFLIILFSAGAFSNERLDSMLLQPGEIRDTLGDFTLSPILLDRDIFISLGSGFILASEASEAKWHSNAFGGILYYEKTDNSSSEIIPSFILAKKLRSWTFGAAFSSFFVSSDDYSAESSYSDLLTDYISMSNTTKTADLSELNASLEIALDLKNIAFGLTCGFHSSTGKTGEIYKDVLDSGNDTEERTENSASELYFIPSLALSIGSFDLLLRCAIDLYSGKEDLGWNGTVFNNSWEGSGTGFGPGFSVYTETGTVLWRAGLLMSFAGISREYLYSTTESTWDYENGISGTSYFITATLPVTDGMLVIGSRGSFSSYGLEYFYDNDTSNAAYENTVIALHSGDLDLFAAFERIFFGFLKLRAGLRWSFLGYAGLDYTLKDETGTTIESSLTETSSCSWAYSLGLGIRLFRNISFEISFNGMPDLVNNSTEVEDRMNINNIAATETGGFKFSFDIIL